MATVEDRDIDHACSPRPRVSIVVPVYYEGAEVLPPLNRLLEAVALPCEILVVYDTPDDTTVPYLEQLARSDSRVIPIQNTYDPGPAHALRFGFDRASSPVVVVTMADGSDDPQQIEPLVRLIERGVVIAAASRYMRGGRQVGGRFPKAFLSRLAGVSLYWFARAGTHDATNSFKAYDAGFVRGVTIESERGFEMGLEMVAKARRARQPVVEIPTIWIDRDLALSNFQLKAWIWQYLRWFVHAFGPRAA